MSGGKRSIAIAAALLVSVTGCGRLAPQEAFEDVSFAVGERTGKRVHWDTGTEEDLAAQAAVDELLSRPLTSSGAVQVALLNNRSLQAAYAEIGIAQANLVQAGLLSNPVFDGAVTWFADAGGTPNLAFGVAWSFVDLLKLPRRKAVARSRLEEAKLNVARRVIAHAADTHAAFIAYVAAREEAELLRGVERTARASVGVSTALREAGNVTELEFEQNQAFLTRTKLDLARAEARIDEVREKLNLLMGTTGGQIDWSVPAALPDTPAAIDTRQAERRAVEASLDIAAARQKLVTLGREFRLVRKQSLLPDGEAGVEFEREIEVEDAENGGTEKSRREAVGPTFEIAIPIFDRGQARKAGALMQMRKAEDELWSLAVRVRSVARLQSVRLRTAEKTVAYYRKAVLPQTERILDGTRRDYNAMQQGVFRLIEARREQIQAQRQAIEAQRDYWLAHVRFRQLMNGSLPAGNAGNELRQIASAAAPSEGANGGGH